MRKVLYFMFGLLTLNESNCVGELVQNPVNAIVRRYNTVTPESTVASFKTSTAELIKRLGEAEGQYSRHSMLNTKWKHGIEVLNAVVAFDPSASSSDRERVYTLVHDITDNGFFDVSNTAITIEPTLSGLRSLFNDFWHHLLQAKEITTWWLCSAAEVTVEEVPYLCFEASKLIDSADDAYNALWAISVLGDIAPAIWELDEEGYPTPETIIQVKKDARSILRQTVSTNHFTKSLVEHLNPLLTE